MRGGANSRRVRDVIAAGLARGGVQVTHEIITAVVEDLESSGYRIVRAGQVPKLDELEHTLGAMDLVRDTLTGKVHDLGATGAVDGITLLRELALNVLSVDIDDVDEPDEVTF